MAKTTESTAYPTVNSNRRFNTRMTQNFYLVWLHDHINEISSDDYSKTIGKLREVVNNVSAFIDVDECIDFVTDAKEERAFLIISGDLNQMIIPIVQEMVQVSSIFVLCENTIPEDNWVEKSSKVQGVYPDITSICAVLKQAAHHWDQNSVPISFIKKTQISTPNLDQLDPSFMYTQILKEILLTINFQQKHLDEFLTYSRQLFIHNPSELRTVEKLDKDYHNHKPIWWYTCQCFLYSMLNRALRTMEVDLIIKLGFFVRDLHNDIVALHAEQYGGQQHSDSFIVYRGQGLSQTDFDQLRSTQGGLLSFNNFLSTSFDRAVSFAYAESNQYHPDLIGILFVITIHPSISSSPFANIKTISYFEEAEEELLFSMHSVFRLGEVKQIDNNERLWQVELTLTSDNDPQLHHLAESIREEMDLVYNGWYRLGKLLMKLGEFEKAKELYGILLEQTTDEGEKAYLYNQFGQIKTFRGEYTKSIPFYENSLKILQKILPPVHPDVATSYSDIGVAYKQMGELSKALSYHQQALEMRQKALPANHPHLAASYNDVGSVCNEMGEYSKALSSHEKALEIRRKALPANHPDLANSYNNIGLVYNNKREYSKGLPYLEKALEISQKALPTNHPDLTTVYNNIGGGYYFMGEYSKALSYYEKALQILENTLPANHLRLTTFYGNIGSLYINIGEYPKGLLYYEKELEIHRKILPANDPKLATSYHNIGHAYAVIDENWKALSYYEKAYEIWQKTLPPDHLDLAIFHTNIGAVYADMGEHSKALSSHKKHLKSFKSSSC